MTRKNNNFPSCCNIIRPHNSKYSLKTDISQGPHTEKQCLTLTVGQSVSVSQVSDSVTDSIRQSMELINSESFQSQCREVVGTTMNTYATLVMRWYMFTDLESIVSHSTERLELFALN
jgi:hypothetical protein